MGPTVLRRCGPQKPPEQGPRSSDVLACPSEVWEGFIVLYDPPIHVTGHDARTPTISMVLELESCFRELLGLGL